MAYNLQPLITILEGILDENNPQLQSLYNKATSLQKLLDSKSSFTKLDSQIREVTHQAEDIIESHMVDQMRFSTLDLEQVARDLDSIIEQAEKLMKMEGKETRRELYCSLEQVKLVEVENKKRRSRHSSSSRAVVGIDADLMQLKDRLTRWEKKREIVPIVGMGGIGKTTLARELYEDPLIVCHFAYRAWTTISQDYNMRQILISLLRCIIGKEESDKHKGKGIHELKDMLHRSLYGRKYLIVLDDTWSTKFWDEMRAYFPNNNNGSRIVITTRESDVANYADSSRSQHQVQLLSEFESCNLLHQLVFGKEDCPPELQDIVRKIANDCSGLPLAISVIGGLLSTIERSEDAWKKIGNNVIETIAELYQQCISILSLSYNHLPNHLKPCFLYMGAYPEDYEIKGSRLVHLWVAEGFVKSNGEKSLEEEAEDWLKSLVERNLFMVREKSIYSMHDMLRDLCIRKCDEDKFFYVKNGPNVTFSNPRRVRLDISNGVDCVKGSTESMSLARSVICIGRRGDKFPYGALSTSRLLRVLDFMDMHFFKFPTEIFEFVNLRYLGLNCGSPIPRGISRLWNLQTLIGRCSFEVVSELWQLSELRNLKLCEIKLLEDEKMNFSAMKKLQIISDVWVGKEATTLDGFLKSIPNVKELALIDHFYPHTSMVTDLSHLHKLEILECYKLTGGFMGAPDGHFNVTFPSNIKRLHLFDCRINLEMLRSLRSVLHTLEVLRISSFIYITKSCLWDEEEEEEEEEEEIPEEYKEEWEVAEEDVFCSLQFLYLEGLRLARWTADETNFPRLCHLRVYQCYHLQEIPSAIGEISTLQLIELEECTKSAVASAERIVEEQSEYGNYNLKLRITKTLDR